MSGQALQAVVGRGELGRCRAAVRAGHVLSAAIGVPDLEHHSGALQASGLEQGADGKAAALARDLAILGARTSRARNPAVEGDVNDQLRAVGMDALRTELEGGICAAPSGGVGGQVVVSRCGKSGWGVATCEVAPIHPAPRPSCRATPASPQDTRGYLGVRRLESRSAPPTP